LPIIRLLIGEPLHEQEHEIICGQLCGRQESLSVTVTVTVTVKPFPGLDLIGLFLREGETVTVTATATVTGEELDPVGHLWVIEDRGGSEDPSFSRPARFIAPVTCLTCT
jgi:hypothetical protein